jgi:hypothetical protein
VNIGVQPGIVVVDSQLWTIESHSACHDKYISPYILLRKYGTNIPVCGSDIYLEEVFVCEESINTYRCAAGNDLVCKGYHSHRHTIAYMAKKKDCAACELKIRCAKQSLEIYKTRQRFMERFCKRNGQNDFDLAGWRGLWKMSFSISYLYNPEHRDIALVHNKTEKSMALPQTNYISVAELQVESLE